MININKDKFKMSVKIEYDGDIFVATLIGSVKQLIKGLKDYDLDHVIQIIILPYIDEV